jgi:plasmid maintenance system antidote protein VapI
MVTDSTLLIDHVVMANRASTSNESQTITIRKLGGTTDGVAQIVYGEAALARNTTVLVFLRLGSDGQFWVSAMAQGEYRVETATDGVPRLQRSRNLDMVVHPERSVVETLDGTTLKQAEAIVNASIAKTRKLP